MKRVVFVSVVAAMILAQGCAETAGPRTMAVSGEASFDGKPIKDGVITFEGVDGAAPAQGPIKEGMFSLPAESGPVADKEYIVKINALVKSGKTVKNVMDESSPTMEVMAETIPALFNTESKVRKTISSDASKNQFIFKLTSSGAFE
jgi:hypothetical protein